MDAGPKLTVSTEEAKMLALPRQEYDIYLVDPPWPQQKGGLRRVRPNQIRDLSYRTLSLGQIERILRGIFPSERPHCVFLWEVDKFLTEAEQLMQRLGYRRHVRLIWDKGNGTAPAFTVRFTHEYLVWWYRPKLLPVDTEARGKLTTVIRAAPREHSRKPDAAYHYVETLYPCCRRLDVFARERREGWDVWGDEVDYYPAKGSEE